MEYNGLVFNTKRMPEKWRRHFKIYRAKISIFLDTADFGTPLMVDASEMMGFLPADIDLPSFTAAIGPVKPGGEAVWIEAEVPDGLPSRPKIRRIGAMVHHSRTRSGLGANPWTGAENEHWIEAYLRDADGLATKLEQEVRFRLDDRGFLSAVEYMGHRKPQFGPQFEDGMIPGHYEVEDGSATAVEVMNRVFFALALMNCRNVSLRERGSSRSAGPGPTGDAFHEVVIDGTARGSGRGSGEAAGTAAGRAHLARGHFKTFTEEAPLLGKHVGTYWWGWQVRGQESTGVIEKTYRLKPGSQ